MWQTVNSINIKQARVNQGDWNSNGATSLYKGKYHVGRYKMSNEFILQYMQVIHKFSDNNYTSRHDDLDILIPDNAVVYMEHYDIIDKRILLNMRDMIKSPQNGFVVVRQDDVITGIYKDDNHEFV